MAKKKKKTKKSIKKARNIAIISLSAIGAVLLFGFLYLYNIAFQPNVKGIKDKSYFYVNTGDNYNDVLERLEKLDYIDNYSSLVWVLEQKNYRQHVKAGKFRINAGMSNNDIANTLRSGNQEPVQLKINNPKSPAELAGIFGNALEPDSLDFIAAFNNKALLNEYGFDKDNIMCLFLPNTYQFHWNTSVTQTWDRFQKEYKNFWNEERQQMAQRMKLTPNEVIILASIVNKETSKKDEYARVAGVYVNRLNKKIKLQADPTLIFALGDYTIKRVLNIHKKVDSPYNTYMYRGLPPGPISLPSLACIDGVLNYENHKYIFFCAKEDFSGYHAFATTYNGHLANARRYQRALNQRKIYR